MLYPIIIISALKNLQQGGNSKEALEFERFLRENCFTLSELPKAEAMDLCIKALEKVYQMLHHVKSMPDEPLYPNHYQSLDIDWNKKAWMDSEKFSSPDNPLEPPSESEGDKLK